MQSNLNPNLEHYMARSNLLKVTVQTSFILLLRCVGMLQCILACTVNDVRKNKMFKQPWYILLFCFGEFTFAKEWCKITESVEKSYLWYFVVKIWDQAPHVTCRCCQVKFMQCGSGPSGSFKFGVPMIWQELTNCINDCYFCMVKTVGFNPKNRHLIKCTNIPSAKCPVALHQKSQFQVPLLQLKTWISLWNVIFPPLWWSDENDPRDITIHHLPLSIKLRLII